MKRIRIFNIALIVAALMLIALIAMPAQAAYYAKLKWTRISAVAGEAISAGEAVAIKDADGYAYAADANDSDLRPAVGVAGKDAASGANVEIVIQGVFSGWSSLTEGQPGYLSETAGAITQSAPSWDQQVGIAISTTDYYVNCGNYFDSSTLTALGVLSGASPIIMEGASADAYETTIAVTDPTADNTITLPDASGVPILSAAIPDAATGIWGAANSLVAEGATANAYETTVAFTDPTADRTVTVPDAGGTVMLSSLATNGADAANAVTGASNGLVFEGATANDYETTVSSTDPTADRSVVLPDAGGTVMLSSLATNGADAANAVTGASNGLVFEGATADAYETTVSSTDPTADRSVVLPDAGGTVMLSSLATNGADAANAVTGTSNGLVFEGATADAYETTVSSTDPTADRTITLPDASGTVDVCSTASHDYSGGHADWTLSASEAQATYIIVTNADGGCNAILPAATAGKIFFINNTSGQILTFKVTGQSGGTIANAKTAIYADNGTDVVEIYEKP